MLRSASDRPAASALPALRWQACRGAGMQARGDALGGAVQHATVHARRRSPLTTECAHTQHAPASKGALPGAGSPLP